MVNMGWEYPANLLTQPGASLEALAQSHGAFLQMRQSPWTVSHTVDSEVRESLACSVSIIAVLRPAFFIPVASVESTVETSVREQMP